MVTNKIHIAKKFEISNEDRKKVTKNKRPLFETRIIYSLTELLTMRFPTGT